MSKFVRSSVFVCGASRLRCSCLCPGPAADRSAAPPPRRLPRRLLRPTEDPLAMYMPDAVTGDIVTAGSSTVFPLSERMVQRFGEEGFGRKDHRRLHRLGRGL